MYAGLCSAAAILLLASAYGRSSLHDLSSVVALVILGVSVFVGLLYRTMLSAGIGRSWSGLTPDAEFASKSKIVLRIVAVMLMVPWVPIYDASQPVTPGGSGIRFLDFELAAFLLLSSAFVLGAVRWGVGVLGFEPHVG